MQTSVKEDRNRYIGGSDIPVIMGISPFRTRFDLLLEKAELKEDTFEGNEYTEYGTMMESKIREYINQTLRKEYVEGKHISGDIRIHTDGEDEESILEIKTTSQIHDSVDDYKIYLVQLLFYMENAKKTKGLLAVYNRPEDFNEEFENYRLQLFNISIEDYKDLIDEINRAVEQFRIDLEKVKENPLITEEELVPTSVRDIAERVVQLETQLAAYNVLNKQYEDAKQQLKTAMENQGLKKWTTPNGTQITLTPDSPDKEVEEEYFDEEKFVTEHPEIHDQYMAKRVVFKKGRKGYVKITLPKE